MVSDLCDRKQRKTKLTQASLSCQTHDRGETRTSPTQRSRCVPTVCGPTTFVTPGGTQAACLGRGRMGNNVEVLCFARTETGAAHLERLGGASRVLSGLGQGARSQCTLRVTAGLELWCKRRRNLVFERSDPKRTMIIIITIIFEKPVSTPPTHTHKLGKTTCIPEEAFVRERDPLRRVW